MIDREALKAEIIARRGYWHPFHEGLLELAPEFLQTYLHFQDAPARSGHLEPKVCEFIYIAIDGAVSHLYERGLRRHIEDALRLGATKEEVLQVIMLAKWSVPVLLVKSIVSLAPQFAEGFLGYGEVAWTVGPLAPKVKAFIGLAVCASPALLHEAGMRQHIRQALDHGATKEEISDVLALAIAIAIHTCTNAVPALVEAVRALPPSS